MSASLQFALQQMQHQAASAMICHFKCLLSCSWPLKLHNFVLSCCFKWWNVFLDRMALIIYCFTVIFNPRSLLLSSGWRLFARTLCLIQSLVLHLCRHLLPIPIAKPVRRYGTYEIEIVVTGCNSNSMNMCMGSNYMLSRPLCYFCSWVLRRDEQQVHWCIIVCDCYLLIGRWVQSSVTGCCYIQQLLLLLH